MVRRWRHVAVIRERKTIINFGLSLFHNFIENVSTLLWHRTLYAPRRSTCDFPTEYQILVIRVVCKLSVPYHLYLRRVTHIKRVFISDSMYLLQFFFYESNPMNCFFDVVFLFSIEHGIRVLVILFTSI